MGSMMALEAIKLIAGAGTPLRGALLIYDALHAETRRIRTARARLPGLPRHRRTGAGGMIDDPPRRLHPRLAGPRASAG